MKKCYQIFVAITALFFSITLAFAEAPPTEGYATSQMRTPAKGMLQASYGAVRPTNIFVVNQSNYDLHVLVPNRDQKVDGGGTGLITHDSYTGDTTITITDSDYQKIFEVTVCHRAVLTIDGYPRNFHLNVDRKYC